MKIFTAAAAASMIATGLIATATIAQPVVTNVRVSYADLNLSSSAGKVTLARRINAAAKSACAVDANERDLMMKAITARCHVTAVSGARTAIAAATTPSLASR